MILVSNPRHGTRNDMVQVGRPFVGEPATPPVSAGRHDSQTKSDGDLVSNPRHGAHDGMVQVSRPFVAVPATPLVSAGRHDSQTI